MASAEGAAATVLSAEDDVAAAVAEAMRADAVAVDVEASGMHAYRARICTMQLAWDTAPGDRRVVVVDALATSVAALGPLLGAAAPLKIVHDVAFDARLLAEAGVALEGVHDTAIAARMLGIAATGLATLLEAHLGVRIRKGLQHHDWRIRPLDGPMLDYLVEDVRHVRDLERVLWAAVVDKGIDAEVLEETRYRIACAGAAAHRPPERAPYLDVRGADRLTERELAVLHAVFPVREREAEARDVPPHRIASADALTAIARARPTTAAALVRAAGPSLDTGNRGLVDRLVDAVRRAGDTIPDADRAAWAPKEGAAALGRARRERETRLTAWRRAAAAARGVDEQVVLPGHCLKDIAASSDDTLAGLGAIGGIGAFRVARDGEAVLAALGATRTDP